MTAIQGHISHEIIPNFEELVDDYKNSHNLEVLLENKEKILNQVEELEANHIDIVISTVATMVSTSSGRKKLRVMELWACMQKTKKQLQNDFTL